MSDARTFGRRSRPWRTLFLAACSLVPALVASVSYAQAPTPDAQLEALRRLDYMVGDWQGEGWIEIAGARYTFRGGELVQRKLGGAVLLVEGNFLTRMSGAANEVPVHTTLGVISYDPRTQKYRFSTWLGNGGSGERELVLQEGGWQWEIPGPQGVIRYRMWLTPQGEWLEVGERSADGQNWSKFFEMTLRKAQ